MFFRKKRHSIMGMNMDADMDMMSAIKIVAAGALIYHTARFMFKEMIDE